MSRVEQWKTAAEAHRIITHALEIGECVVLSNVGAFVGTKAEAMMTFRLLVIERSKTKNEAFDVFELEDASGRPAIGFDLSEPNGCYLYGVEPNDFALHAADLGEGGLQ